jgi:YVTN family beta-propeller protein
VVYRKHGFVCASGRLHKVAKPKPTTKPLVTRVMLPAAQPLPAGTVGVALPNNAGQGAPGLAASASAVWASGGVWRIDPSTNAAADPLTDPALSPNITVGEGSVWVSDFSFDLVRRYDEATGRLLATIQLPTGSAPESLVEVDGAIWVADHHSGTLSRIDSATNTLVATIKIGNAGSSGPQGIAAGLGSIWVGVPNTYSVVRVDPTTNAVRAIIPMPGLGISPCGGLAVGQTAVWVTGCLDEALIARIDPGTNKVASILDVGGFIAQVAADGAGVWFVSGGPQASPPEVASLMHLDAADHVLSRFALPTGFVSGGVAVAFGSVWLSDNGSARVVRVPEPG